MHSLINIFKNLINNKKSHVSIKYFSLLCFFSMSPIFADLTWQLPAQEVSLDDSDHDQEKIVTDASGANVHIVWRKTGPNRAQTTSSNDFGNNWSPPLTLNTTGAGTSAQTPQVATDNTGKYVYVVYSFNPGGGFRILFTRSTDFGQTWLTGASQTTLSPILSSIPDVTTNNSGQYVYAIWANSTTDDVQFSRSVDFGANWPLPANVTNLSDTTDLSLPIRVVTDDSGQYVHAIWTGFKAPDTIRQIQTSSSSDFGVTWTPLADIPKLSAKDSSASFQDLATDSSGKYVYVVWHKSIGGATIVQFSRSIDFGANWTASPGVNLSSSAAGVSSTRPKVATDRSGRYIFVIWDHSGGGADQSIRIRRSTDFGATWENPIVIPSDKPNSPRIAIDNVGRYVYAIWGAKDGAAFIRESSLSFDFGQTFTTPIRVSSQTEDSFGTPAITTNDSGIYGYSSFSEQNTEFFQVMQVLRGIDIPRTIKRFDFVRP